jgi:hypothetical protein
MQEEYDEQGLTILSATGESKDVVDRFVEELEAAYPILCQAGTGEYSTGGVPTSYLITPDGKVAWHGHPNALDDDLLEEKLRDVEKEHRVSTWMFLVQKALPVVPDDLSGVMRSLEKRKFGYALKEVESKLDRFEGEEREAAEKIRDWISNRGTSSMEAAEAFVSDGKIYRGFVLYEQIEDEFKGHDLAKSAKDAAKALKSDKQNALEIKASEKLEDIKRDMAEERDAEDKLKCLKPLLSRKYEETLAGKEAAEMAAELEKEIE